MSEFISMATYLDIAPERVSSIVRIILDYFDGEGIDVLRQRMQTELGTVSSSEFAYAAQLSEADHADPNDPDFKRRHEEMLHVVFGQSVGLASDVELHPGHPAHTFLQENIAINRLVSKLRAKLDAKFELAWWAGAYEQLWQVNTHYVRKENQLFPFLEKKGFDRPSSMMWSIHDDIRAGIKANRQLLAAAKVSEFLAAQDEVLAAVVDMTFKEEKILLPTSLAMLSTEDWIEIRRGEDEIGYCLIDSPPEWSPEQAITKQCPSQTVRKSTTNKVPARRFTPTGKRRAVNVGAIGLDGGFVTPEQINLLFKKLPLDITFVDEWDRVKFYNRGDERVFPRSPGIIDREVRYCHPPKSVHVVLDIVNAFKAGERDSAEFWIQMGGRFLHIRYFAVRDSEGNYKGVLEVSQDATHIRVLENNHA